ncbi:actin depolymerizing protein [Zopfia rhizophila CBS 207.26]|uniref:Actin depolymerizing protein n=1 Tax=Zopfia rhizophila CBS 207.26 TaxID=1314779 RepID=A0A6A6DG75_9PEZI|nr:actin depolymerizing protein [Zopfia rhizophila CBS 207.26]
MPPHEGLVHLKEYDWRDSNVELIDSELDHQVKYKSATTEPAWNNGTIGNRPGLFIWRIEEFEVIPWPKEKYGEFHEGDSYIVLHSQKLKTKDDEEEDRDKLIHDIFFWLGAHTSQDEAGTAAYKTVELDEFLHGAATQHRELQFSPSDDFLALFPRLKILKGGVRSGFTHVEQKEEKPGTDMLLRIFKHPSPAAGKDSIMVHEVEPTWESLDEDDVFVLDRGDKIWVWQGKNCSPMEKMKAAQVVNDMTIAKHVDVEVLAQLEARSKVVVDYLGGEDVNPLETIFKAERPIAAPKSGKEGQKKLFRLSDASGQLSFDLTKEGDKIQKDDLDGNDVFLLDTGKTIWVWEGRGASRAEKAMWIRVAQAYVRQLQEESKGPELYAASVAKVVEGNESPAFWKVVDV